MLRHAENAVAVANALTRHPRVRRVYYPGLATHPGHAIARRQMTGFGGMVSFELDGTVEEVVSFVSGRRFVCRRGASITAISSPIWWKGSPRLNTHARSMLQWPFRTMWLPAAAKYG